MMFGGKELGLSDKYKAIKGRVQTRTQPLSTISQLVSRARERHWYGQESAGDAVGWHKALDMGRIQSVGEVDMVFQDSRTGQDCLHHGTDIGLPGARHACLPR